MICSRSRIRRLVPNLCMISIDSIGGVQRTVDRTTFLLPVNRKFVSAI